MKPKVAPAASPRLKDDAAAARARALSAEVSGEASGKLLDELRVQRLEPETPNEALRQAQIALEESRKRYIDLYDFAPIGYITLDAEGRIDEVNLTAATLLGIERNELMTQRLAEFVAPGDQQTWQKFFLATQQQAERRTCGTCELAVRRADGTFLELRMDVRPAAAGAVVPLLRIALTDVTERNRLAQELSRRERYQRALLDNFPFLVWLKDENHRYLAVNRPFAEARGQSSVDQMIGKSDLDLWPRDLAEAYRADDQAVLTSGKPRVVEEQAELDGQRVWVETYKSPVSLDGQVIGTVGFATDITERKRSMLELQASEERLRLAKESANLGIFDRDIANGGQYWDARARELWGVGPDEPVSFSMFLEGVHPDDRAKTLAAIDQACDPRGTGQYSTTYRIIGRIDGKVREVSTNGQVYFKDGRPMRIIGTLQDISEPTRLERELRESRSAMDQLARQQVAAHTAAAIAHELNQPLVSISAYSDAALRMLRGGKNPERLERALQGAMEQAQRAGRTLHELLAFLGKGEVAAEPVALNKLIDEALAIAEKGGYGGFHPATVLERDLPRVLANRLQVQKVLVNLLQNSVDAMRLAGTASDTVTITARRLEGADMAQVTVRDSGPGLGAETCKRIFEPFFTTKQQGVGLGLSISRALIEAHGGRLWVDPETNGGATFHFTLPIA